MNIFDAMINKIQDGIACNYKTILKSFNLTNIVDCVARYGRFCDRAICHYRTVALFKFGPIFSTIRLFREKKSVFWRGNISKLNKVLFSQLESTDLMNIICTSKKLR